MAYFANGSEGSILDAQCFKCLYEDNDELMCPVHHVHLEYNYDQCSEGQEKLKAAMNILIGEDGICRMRNAIIKTQKQ